METIIQLTDQVSQTSSFNNVRTKDPYNCGYVYTISGIPLKNTQSIASFFTSTRELFAIDFAGFQSLIESRITYLDSLKNLGDNWISGTSKQPSDEVIAKGKELLNEILLHFRKNYTPSFPTIIMGPMPVGGMSFEIRCNSNIAFLNIHNNGTFDMETLIDDYYKDVFVSEENFIQLILNHISCYGSGGDYSGRRQAI
jgi:hypothetical protein